MRDNILDKKLLPVTLPFDEVCWSRVDELSHRGRRHVRLECTHSNVLLVDSEKNYFHEKRGC